MGLTQTPTAVSVANSQAPANKGVGLIKIVVTLAAGILLAAGVIKLLPDVHFNRTTLNAMTFYPGMVVLMLVGLYLSVAIHELGHLVAGTLVRFRFMVLVVGPLQITRQERGVRLGYSGRLNLTGGLLGCIPTDDRDVVRRVALMIAGGPLANLSQFAFAYVLLFTLRDSQVSVWLGITLLLMACLSVMIFLLSALPFKTMGFMTDAARLLSLPRGGPQVERMAASFVLAGISASGQRPRDRDPIWYERILSLSDGSGEEAAAHFFAYARALDAGNPDQAAAFLDRSLSLWQKIPPVQRARYFLEAAYFEGRHGDNPADARTWLDRAQGGMLLEPHARLRAEAAVLLAEGQLEGARERANQGLAAIKHTFDKGFAKAEADWLREIIALSEQQPAAGEPSS